MKDRAFAKINLCLDVVGVRNDGYHELKMIMTPINFYDVLEMVPGNVTNLSINRSYLPVNDKNTIIKAIKIMRERYSFSQDFQCNLTKHIPTQAGLAGGSADAAAAIRIMNRMLHLHMKEEEMLEVAALVGSDVPFCILNKPAYVEGAGEKITPFVCNTDFHILLVKPRQGVSTKEAFAIIDKGNDIHPDCMAMQRALETNDYEGVISNLGNSLEKAAITLVEDIHSVKNRLEGFGFDGVLMSGSGSTVFGITRNEKLLEGAMAYFKEDKYFVRKTRLLNENEYNR